MMRQRSHLSLRIILKRYAWVAASLVAFCFITNAVFASRAGTPGDHIAVPTAAWQHPIPFLRGMPTISGDLALAVQDRSIVAVDIKSGATRWQRDLADDLSDTSPPLVTQQARSEIFTPVVTGNRVLISVSEGSTGHMMVLDLQTGMMIWHIRSTGIPRQVETRGPILSRPALWHDAVIFRTGLGLTALHLADGKEIWNVPFDPNGSVPGVQSAQPVVDENAIYFNSDFGIVYAFAPQDGHIIWSRPTEGISIKRVANVMKINFVFTVCHPLLMKDKLIVADGRDSIYAMSPKDGSTLWQAHPGHAFQIESQGDKLYAGTQNGFAQIDLMTGKILRQYEVPKGIFRFAVTGDTAILSGYPTGWQIFSLRDWKPLSQSPNFAVNDIAIGQGRFYLSGFVSRTTQDGEIRAYNVSM